MRPRSMHSVLLWLLCLFMTCAIVSSSFGSSNIRCQDRERNALLRFKQGLVDESNVLAYWESNKDCCEWRGIECNNQTGHVITLNLYYSSSDETPLRGEIDSSLLELQHLNYLDLSSNNFEGMIPKFIGSLSQLKELKLAAANFSGSIPPQLGNLTNLCTLDLEGNYVTFENLEWLSHLSSLRYLNMAGLDFSGIINWPQSLSKVTSLIVLLLSGCDLPDVNLRSLSFINSSTSLVYLDLSDNKLEGGIPETLQNLCSLESLYLESNQFSQNIVLSLKTLSCAENTLETLFLSGNRFWGSLPDLTGFSKLRFLYLSNNQLNGSLPERVGQLSNLEALDISSNSLDGVITEVHFLNLSRLQYLDVFDNPLY